MKDKDRYMQALNLRTNGLTFSEIGKRFGVSRGRASQMVATAERMLRQAEDEFSQLPLRIKNALFLEGYRTKEAVLEGVKSGKISPYVTNDTCIPNYGVKSHKEVLAWLGIEQITTTAAANEKTIKQYIAYLERNGYIVSKKITKAEKTN